MLSSRLEMLKEAESFEFGAVKKASGAEDVLALLLITTEHQQGADE